MASRRSGAGSSSAGSRAPRVDVVPAPPAPPPPAPGRSRRGGQALVQAVQSGGGQPRSSSPTHDRGEGHRRNVTGRVRSWRASATSSDRVGAARGDARASATATGPGTSAGGPSPGSARSPRPTSSGSATPRRRAGPDPRPAHGRPRRQGGRAGHGHQGLLHHPALRGFAAVLVQLRAAHEEAAAGGGRGRLAGLCAGALWPAPSSASLSPTVRVHGRGTPHESLNRNRTQRSSAGTHSHSVMEAWTMRTQPRR